MSEIEGESAADSEDWSDLMPETASDFDQDWDAVTSLLPLEWQAKAYELGALRRLRGFSSVEALLRVLLIHLSDGCSLRETAVRARAGNLADVSDVALLKRLRGCGEWFQWMSAQLAANLSLVTPPDTLLGGRRVRLVDGSSVCEPGATGSTWRLHYALNLSTLSCDEVHVTQANVGESLTLFSIEPGDVIMADRGFAKRPSLRHVVEHKADVILRMSWSNLPLQDAQGQPFALLSMLRTLCIGQAGDWQAWAHDGKGAIAVRVCVYKKTQDQAQVSRQAIEREARKKQKVPMPETLEVAGYVIVLTTLMQPSAQAILEFYRRRWQIELSFKRLKSLLQLGHLKKTDAQGAKAWLQGKLLVACLIESLIFTAERFSPWGYRTGEREIHAPALPLA